MYIYTRYLWSWTELYSFNSHLQDVADGFGRLNYWAVTLSPLPNMRCQVRSVSLFGYAD